MSTRLFDKEYDVLVAGAGVAGVAAALESARAGLRTALLEKTVMPGGLATAGLINIYLPLCDGHGRQVTYGISEELLHLSIKYGPGDIPQDWSSSTSHSRLYAPFSPASFILAMDEALISSGVDIWLDTLACAPIMEGSRIKGIEVENKDGRIRIGAKCIVDATGDADLAFRAGAPCTKGDNCLSIWAIGASEDRPEDSSGLALLDMYRLGGDNAGVNAPPGSATYSGISGRQVSNFVLEGRRLLLEHYKSRQEFLGRSGAFPVTLPGMAQLRTTRCITGGYTLKEYQQNRRFEDSIGLVADWRKPGYIWEVPYRTLVPQGVDGLIAAGRCISSTGDAWEVTRVVPAAAFTGQVAGIAATLSAQGCTTPGLLAPADMQKELKNKGIPLHLEDIDRL
jgi:hypothetical protein